MNVAMFLRGTAILIAAAGLIDPVVTLARWPPQSVVVATRVSDANRDRAETVAAGIESALKGRMAIVRRSGTASACEAGESCVVIADGTRSPGVSDTAGPWHLVRLEADPSSLDVGIDQVSSAPAVHAAGAGSLSVFLVAANARAVTTTVRAFDGDVMVGETEHRWNGEPSAQLVLDWWPVADGARLLRVETVTGGDTWAVDDAVFVGVEVVSTATPVMVYETRPSWPATFVRRALESDARLRVEARSRLGPSLSSSTPAARLDARALDGFPVVVVGGPADLSRDEADLLDRYVTVRGGTLILLPDTASPGASARWLSAGWRERVSATPQALGSLQASEYLQADRPGPLDRALVTTPEGAAAVLLSPSGSGRVIVSGAMDAWRYRDAGGQAFARFWQGLVSDAARLEPALDISPASSAPSPGQWLPIGVTWHGMEAPSSVTIRASMQCASRQAIPVRLWPAATGRGFEGRVRVGVEGPCRIDAAIEGGPSASMVLPVSGAGDAPAIKTLAAMTASAVASGGTGVAASRVQEVVDGLRALTRPVPVETPVAPMQSGWWLLPFAGCLAGEWWLRRRSGLR